ncbi:BglG family transcription antiterminator LicT [Vagococcus fluvialis]|uniref:BglG family transcription antiterminator LicT n=1 Tax=Vagococcus fluvialis TaxID=2738 RepID=UPI001A8F7292|nr:PRD domain-containing protein [Vagococcus fluvialis]MBO0488180.1 PRD domain-containing protein [Vagococcus fluvialis]
MKIIRIINNNIVTSEQDGNEVVVMGKAIGYKMDIGNKVDEEKIEKIFYMEEKNKLNQFELLLREMPLNEIQTVDEIISYAKLSLGKKLSEGLYISLIDHIHFAIERHHKGYEFKNDLSWEVKHFYHHEYLIGKEALEIISRRLHVKLPIEEATTIALHIVNAEMENDMERTVGLTKMIKEIISIIQYTFNRKLSEDSLSYERLLTHLKFFSKRVLLNRPLPDENKELFALIEKSYPKEYQCALKIGDYVHNETKHKLTVAELSYITIHINRVINDE